MNPSTLKAVDISPRPQLASPSALYPLPSNHRWALRSQAVWLVEKAGSSLHLPSLWSLAGNERKQSP